MVNTYLIYVRIIKAYDEEVAVLEHDAKYCVDNEQQIDIRSAPPICVKLADIVICQGYNADKTP